MMIYEEADDFTGGCLLLHCPHLAWRVLEGVI